MEAKYYTQKKDLKVQCNLCPHNCIINENKSGICRVRKNIAGKLIAETYRQYSSISFDPIEKKPLYHYYPASQILSLGSVGCNLRCQWCQNCEISQSGVEGAREFIQASPEHILRIAQSRSDNIGVAYTYNEPLIAFETIIEVAELVKSKQLKNVMVSNGYFGQEVLKEYLKFIDAFNVDVKAFDNQVYKINTGADLLPVLNNLVEIERAGKHLELTFLLIPEVNDNPEHFKDFIKWVIENLGKDTVLHISKYFPRFNLHVPATEESLLLEFAHIASEQLHYVFLGNCYTGKYTNTNCPVCGKTLIERLGYSTTVHRKTANGTCPDCQAQIFVGGN